MDENETEVITQEVDTETTENTEEVDVEALKKENETLKAQKEHWREKAEKVAEKEKGTAKATTDTLTPKDYLALTENGVKSEDFDEIIRVAGLLEKTVSDALQDNVLKTILKTRQEERATAQATQTGGGSRGVKSASPEVLLQKAESGEVSEDDIEKLTQARMEQRLRK
jgi:hypothetical protein